jgi:hydrogenase maturation factor
VTVEEVSGDSLAAAALVLARRFAAGATMWCVAPEWPAHGRHVAVEFVHPVIVGKRALPAVHVEGPDLTGSLRLLVRPGDILLVVGTATSEAATLMRRADAWGVVTVWLGAGPPPDPGAADHVVWSAHPEAGRAARSGDVVILYHLLWELTHVVFEHPGLLTEPPDCDDEVCITCSDEGRVAEVVSARPGGTAEVVSGGQRGTIDVSLLDDVRYGDLVLVHAGTALTTLESTP